MFCRRAGRPPPKRHIIGFTGTDVLCSVPGPRPRETILGPEPSGLTTAGRSGVQCASRPRLPGRRPGGGVTLRLRNGTHKEVDRVRWPARTSNPLGRVRRVRWVRLPPSSATLPVRRPQPALAPLGALRPWRGSGPRSACGGRLAAGQDPDCGPPRPWRGTHRRAGRTHRGTDAAGRARHATPYRPPTQRPVPGKGVGPLAHNGGTVFAARTR